MERISMTIPKSLLDRIDLNVRCFTGKARDKRSAYICQILSENVPSIS